MTSEDKREAGIRAAAPAGNGPGEVRVAGLLLRPGSRVRLNPRPDGAILDLALAGRLAVIEGVEEDDAGQAQVAVVIKDDSGRDGVLPNPAHRFFFLPSELDPVFDEEPPARRVLVAGIGNVFWGDDGFGVEVAGRLFRRTLPEGTEVRDFGVRGLDLAYALVSGYDAAILVDSAPRGGAPGDIYVLEPDLADCETVPFDSHQLDPLAVLGLARILGDLPPQLLVVGCEPNEESVETMSMEMTEEVAAAVDPAVELVVELAKGLSRGFAERVIEQLCEPAERGPHPRLS